VLYAAHDREEECEVAVKLVRPKTPRLDAKKISSGEARYLEAACSALGDERSCRNRAARRAGRDHDAFEPCACAGCARSRHRWLAGDGVQTREGW
jgi:hypothetical protein